MIKLTLLYGIPEDSVAFEEYYATSHTEIAMKMEGIDRVEITKFGSAPDGGPPAYYRMAELYFSSAEQMQETLNSPAGKATLDDLPNFATGGVTSMVGTVDG